MQFDRMPRVTRGAFPPGAYKHAQQEQRYDEPRAGTRFPSNNVLASPGTYMQHRQPDTERSKPQLPQRKNSQEHERQEPGSYRYESQRDIQKNQALNHHDTYQSHGQELQKLPRNSRDTEPLSPAHLLKHDRHGESPGDRKDETRQEFRRRIPVPPDLPEQAKEDPSHSTSKRYKAQGYDTPSTDSDEEEDDDHRPHRDLHHKFQHDHSDTESPSSSQSKPTYNVVHTATSSLNTVINSRDRALSKVISLQTELAKKEAAIAKLEKDNRRLASKLRKQSHRVSGLEQELSSEGGSMTSSMERSREDRDSRYSSKEQRRDSREGHEDRRSSRELNGDRLRQSYGSRRLNPSPWSGHSHSPGVSMSSSAAASPRLGRSQDRRPGATPSGPREPMDNPTRFPQNTRAREEYPVSPIQPEEQRYRSATNPQHPPPMRSPQMRPDDRQYFGTKQHRW